MTTFGLSVLPVVTLLALVNGCSAEAVTTPSSQSDLTERSVQDASMALNAQLFDEADPKEAIDYVLFGTVPGSAERCSVTLAPRGLHPNEYSWSHVYVHPFGESAETVEAHGPVEVAFATTPDQSHDVESMTTNGDQTVFTRKDKPSDGKDEIALTLDFAPGAAKHWDALTRVTIAGTSVGNPKNAACEGLHVGVVLQPSVYEPIVQKAALTWAEDNGDDAVPEFEFQGCDVASFTVVACSWGNETNEETLGMTFKLENGKIGDVIDAQRYSEWE